MTKVKLIVLISIFLQTFEVKCASRIIGGSDALPGSAPYMVSLRYDSLFHFCGGGLINSEWVLTAKHCIDGSGLINVAAGSNTLDPVNVVIKSSSIHVHPEGDIGLVKLSQPIEFNELIQPLDLPDNDIDPDIELRITGWGAIRYEDGETGDGPNDLQTLNVVSMSTPDCIRAFTGIVHELHLCAIAPKGQGICFGDSGSPLVLNNKVYGVASRVVPCAGIAPDIYAKVFYHNDWIRDTMANN